MTALLLLLTAMNLALLVLALLNTPITPTETPAFVSEALARVTGAGLGPTP